MHLVLSYQVCKSIFCNQEKFMVTQVAQTGNLGYVHWVVCTFILAQREHTQMAVM